MGASDKTAEHLGEGGARRDVGPAAVHLERAHGGDETDGARAQAAGAALDVEELFHANVRAKAGLGNDKAVLAHKLEGDLVGDDGRVAVRNVGKGARVHKHGRALHRLHERRRLCHGANDEREKKGDYGRERGWPGGGRWPRSATAR